MKKYDLSLDALNVFCKVVEKNGFHAAADHLELSEPAVSFKIKRLEECVGATLIERGRTIRLTESGQAFYEYAVGALESFEHIRERLLNLEKGMDGELTLAAGASVTKYLLPLVCGRLHADRPEVRISILNCSPAEVCEKVADGTADLGFTIQESLPGKDLSGQIIAVNREIVVARPTPPLARKKTVTPQELSEHRFVMSAEKDRYREIKRGFLKTTGVSVEKSNIVLRDFDMAKRYIRGNDALLIGPMFSLADELAHGTLVPVPLVADAYFSKIRLIKRKDLVMTRLQKDFIKLATKVFQEQLQ